MRNIKLTPNLGIKTPALEYSMAMPEMIRKSSPLKHVMEVEEPDTPEEPFLASLVTRAGGLYSSPAAQLNRFLYRKYMNQPYNENVQLNTLKGMNSGQQQNPEDFSSY